MGGERRFLGSGSSGDKHSSGGGPVILCVTSGLGVVRPGMRRRPGDVIFPSDIYFTTFISPVDDTRYVIIVFLGKLLL